MATILVVDDEPRMRKVISLALSEEGHDVLEADGAESAIPLIRSTTLSLIITDLRMPKGDGTQVLDAARKTSLNLPVIILTAYGTIENAVEALKMGAHDYLLKPCDLDELKLSVNKALRVHHLALENIYLREELSGRSGYGSLLGRSPKMLAIFDLVSRVAKEDSPLLIRGESGTGKEIVARTIHRDSPRREHPFIALSCTALPGDLLEQELFGRVRGVGGGASEASSGKMELAEGGTLFLDEIADLPLRLQAKLLLFLESGTAQPVGGMRAKTLNVRIIASSAMDLEAKVKDGTLRSELFYRLNIVPILVPALREHREDIPLLVEAFLEERGALGKIKFAPDEIARLQRYDWPGNIRELRNVVERAVVLGTTNLNQLMPGLGISPVTQPASPGKHPYESLLELNYREAKKRVLDEFEHYYFSHTLRVTAGNIKRAAEIMGLHRKNLHTKLAELQIDPKQFSRRSSNRLAESSLVGQRSPGLSNNVVYLHDDDMDE